MEKNLEYYMELPYTIEMHQNPEDGWFVRVKELRGCMSHGDTVEEAATMIREAMELWLEVSLDRGLPIPEPRPKDDYSGKFVVRVPRSLHRDLVQAAEEEGVSLNQYINVALAKAVAHARPSVRLPDSIPRDAVQEFPPFQQYVPGEQWTRAARFAQEKPGSYSVNDEKVDGSRAGEQAQDDED